MNAVRLWLGLMAKKLLWVSVAVAVFAGARIAWQRDLVTFSGISAAAKTLVWRPGIQDDQPDGPNSGPPGNARVATSVGMSVFDRDASGASGAAEPAAMVSVAPSMPLSLDRDTKCLARAIYHEATHDPLETRIGIGHVAMVRVAQSAPKTSMCDVVYAGKNAVLGCLFVATCRSAGSAEPSGPAWHSAQQIARDLMTGKLDAPAAAKQPLLAEATHFHPSGERPGWLGQVTRVTQIGRFVFSSRRPVELTAAAATASAAAEPVREETPSEKQRASASPSPRKPLHRGENHDGPSASAPSKSAVKSTEGWFAGSQ